ncbi:MAG: filamentous hemagglutinin N-terminal domain-containing protein, partial [Verrucomicrobia bacterium]|nr:filamentous hemagglutinin N-terminal domain-containing protein [Verrucomicrobiota bacterium]
MLACAVQFALHAHPALANPMGAQVVAGGVQIENAGNVLNIHQSTDRAIIHWQDFSIGAGEITNFLQNGSGAAVLNRVTGGNASQILGALNANGQVMLLNPNGVFIGQGAVVNVGSFMATTANVSDESFLQGGNLSFVGATDKGIVNEGSIHANSGDILLMAKTVENKGTIQAGDGTAALLAGKDFYLKKDVPGAIKVQVSAGAEGSSAGIGVANSGTIEAMQAQLEAQGNVYALAINQAGIIRATGVSRDASGVVVLSAPNGTIRQTGTMLAFNRDGSGGR